MLYVAIMCLIWYNYSVVRYYKEVKYMNLIPLLLLKKAMDQNSRSRSKSRSSSSGRRGYDRYDYSGSSSSSSGPKTPLKVLGDYVIDYKGSYKFPDMLSSRILTAMHENSDVMRVYGKIHTHITSSINAYRDEAYARLVDHPAIDERFRTAEANVKRIKSVEVYTLTVNPYGFDDDYSYIYSRYNPNSTGPKDRLTRICYQSLTIYGVRITEDMLHRNPFRSIYSYEIENYPKFVENYNKAKKKVERLEKSKFLLKIFPKRREKLDTAKWELQRAEDIKTRAEICIERANNFDNMSNEERAWLEEYIRAEKALAESNEKSQKDIRIIHELNESSLRYDGRRIIEGFYKDALDSLTPEERAIYEGAPRTVAGTLAQADEEEFARLGAGNESSDGKDIVDQYLESTMVAKTVDVISHVPVEELAGADNPDSE